MKLVNDTKAFFEKQAFGVCTWLGEKLFIPSADIRKFFIYTSFLAIGSPVIVYLILAFLLKLKQYFRTGRTSVWD